MRVLLLFRLRATVLVDFGQMLGSTSDSALLPGFRFGLRVSFDPILVGDSSKGIYFQIART